MAEKDPNTMEVANVNRRAPSSSSSLVDNTRAADRANQRFFRTKRKSEVDLLQKQVERLSSELQETRRELRGYQERERVLRDAFNTAFQVSATTGSLSGDFESTFTPDPGSRLTKLDVGLTNELPSTWGDSIPSSLEDEMNTYQHPFPINFGTGINIELSNANEGFDYSTMNLEEDILLHPQPSTGTSPGSAGSGGYMQDHTMSKAAAAVEEIPIWQGLPLNLPPSTQLDHVILDTTVAFRDISQSGRHHDEMSASRFPSISSLLNRQAKEVKKLYPVSNAAAAQVWRSPIDSFPCRVGFMYMLSHLLRWYICRTQESYEKLPTCIRPTFLQRTIPHPAWIDVIVWPGARDAIIQQMDWTRFEEYRMVTAKSLSVGWPQSDSRSFLDSDDGKHFTLKPEFEEHLRDDKNWSIGIQTATNFPFMRPFCRENE